MTELLEDHTWVIAGNIVSQRNYGDGREARSGTSIFRPNAKVFLTDLKRTWTITDPSDDLYLRLLGQQRQSRRWVVSYVRASHVTNWRISKVYKPSVVAMLRQELWPGFGVEFEWKRERNSLLAVEAILYALREASDNR